MQNWIHTVAVVVQVLSALGVILLVLLQHGKGADMGAAFGSGASGSLFGATGSANFLSRSTGALATVFLISTLGLAFLAVGRPAANESLMQGGVPAPVTTPDGSNAQRQIPSTVLPGSAPNSDPATAAIPGEGSGSVTPGSAPSSVPPVPPADPASATNPTGSGPGNADRSSINSGSSPGGEAAIPK